MNILQKLRHRHDYIPVGVSWNSPFSLELVTTVASVCDCLKAHTYKIRGAHLSLEDVTQ